MKLPHFKGDLGYFFSDIFWGFESLLDALQNLTEKILPFEVVLKPIGFLSSWCATLAIVLNEEEYNHILEGIEDVKEGRTDRVIFSTEGTLEFLREVLLNCYSFTEFNYTNYLTAEKERLLDLICDAIDVIEEELE